VDEAYVKVAGRWRYIYRAVDQFGQVIDVFVSPRVSVAMKGSSLVARYRSLLVAR
jgi:transposase-like protein